LGGSPSGNIISLQIRRICDSDGSESLRIPEESKRINGPASAVSVWHNEWRLKIKVYYCHILITREPLPPRTESHELIQDRVQRLEFFFKVVIFASRFLHISVSYFTQLTLSYVELVSNKLERRITFNINCIRST